jgi:hypothetical protein
MKLAPFLQRSSNRWHGKYVAGLMTAFAGVLLSVGAAGNDAVGGGLIDGTRAPKEVQDIVQSYLLDSISSEGFNQCNKNYNYGSLLKLSDIEAGSPIREYKLDLNRILNEGESFPIMEVVKPIESWIVPIRAHGKYLYFIIIQKSQGNWGVIGSSNGAEAQIWGNIQTWWPESSGFIPILIKYGISKFFHFPQIDEFNLISLNVRYGNEDSVYIASNESRGCNKAAYISPELQKQSFKTGKLSQGAYLTDSKIIFRLLKKEQLEMDDKMKRLPLMRQEEKRQEKMRKEKASK